MTNQELIIELKNSIKNGLPLNTFKKRYNLSNKDCYDLLFNEGKCKFCGSKARFINFKKGYDDICNNKECVRKRRHERTVKTNLEKYGVENVSQLKEIQERKEKTLLEHYGVKDYLNSEFNKKNMYKNGVHVTMTPEAKEHRKQTLLKKYKTLDTFSLNNGRNKSNSKEGRLKAKETLQRNYGVSSTFALEKTKESIKKTCLEHFGVESAAKSEIVKNKVKETCLKKYGKSSFLQTPEYKEKAKKTNLEKYGSEYYLSSEKRYTKLVEEGIWIDKELKNDLELYYEEVWKITLKQNFELLPNFEKRGNIKFKKDAYHLDHRFSISEGFKQGVPPEIIGDIVNLEMIPAIENIRKYGKCSITLKELKELYDERHKNN